MGMGFNNTQLPPMDDGMGEEPMPQDDGMDMSQGDEIGGEDDELMQVIDSLSVEDKAAVLKYAKSMADDKEPSGEDEMPQDDMTMESKIRESMNDKDQRSDEYGGERKDSKMNNKLAKKKNNPFVSKF